MVPRPHLGVKGEIASVYVCEEAKRTHNLDYHRIIRTMTYPAEADRERPARMLQKDC